LVLAEVVNIAYSRSILSGLYTNFHCMNSEPTNQDILDVMNEKFSKVDKNIEDVLDVMNVKFTQVDKTHQDILDVIQIFSESVDKRFERIESTMVTKGYLDDKLFDLRGDLVSLVRKEDYKLTAVINELVKRDVFDDVTAKRIIAMEPYSKV
jgi:hypothetical protein